MDYKKVFGGILIYFVGYLLCLLLEAIVPAMTSVLSTHIASLFSTSTANTITGIIELGTIFIWIIALFIMPLGITIYGLMEETMSAYAFFEAMGAVLFALFAILITYFTYYMLPTFINVITNPILTYLVYISFVMLWLLYVIGIPTYTIIRAKQ